MIYKFYKFTKPEIVLMIATTPEAAMKEYQEEVSDTLEGVSIDELSQLEFISQLVQTTVERTPIIEYGLKQTVRDIQESMVCLEKSGKEAIIAFKKC